MDESTASIENSGSTSLVRISGKIKHEQTLRGVLFILASSVGFSMLGVIAKIAFQHDVTVMQLMTSRFIITLPVFWGIAIYRLDKRELFLKNKTDILFAIFAGITGYYMIPFTGLTSITYIGAALEAIIFATYPAFVIILVSIMRKKLPSPAKLAVLVISQIGLYLAITGGRNIDITDSITRGAWWAILSALASAAYIVTNHHVAKRINSLIFITWCSTGGFVATLLHFILVPGKDVAGNLSLKGFMIIVISALCFTFAYLTFAEGIKRIGGQRASLISSLGPILTVVFSYFILGEVLGLIQILGGAIVIASIVFLEKKTIKSLNRKKILFK